MLFNSYSFLLFFLPLAYMGYRFLLRAGHQEGVILWLNACSFFFYGWWNPAYVPLMAGSIFVNFLIGQRLHALVDKPAGRVLLTIGVTLNLLCLAYFKYTGFLLENLNTLLGTRFYEPGIVLPLAISFFTFQQIAYLVDTWRGQGDTYRLRYYCLFVVFFPHLLAGPIVHHREIIPQFSNRYSKNERSLQLAMGITAISFGLFKKVVLADTAAFYADQVFYQAQAGAAIGFWDAWIGTISFTLQIYFDFSAYSDIACGVALLFGVRLPQNFASPYRSTSIITFWQNWHITLSRFLRHYVYFPLGGNRLGHARRYCNLLATMLLGGLWHGAGWTFVIWGAMHGLLLTINHAWRSRTTGSSFSIPTPIAWLLTYICVALTWVIFRADSVDSAWRLYVAMFDVTQLQWTHDLRQPVISDGLRQLDWDVPALVKILPLLAVMQLWVWCMPNLSRLMRDYQLTPTALPDHQPSWRWQPNTGWSLLTACALATSMMALYDTGNFVYFQF